MYSYRKTSNQRMGLSKQQKHLRELARKAAEARTTAGRWSCASAIYGQLGNLDGEVRTQAGEGRTQAGEGRTQAGEGRTQAAHGHRSPTSRHRRGGSWSA